MQHITSTDCLNQKFSLSNLHETAAPFLYSEKLKYPIKLHIRVFNTYFSWHSKISSGNQKTASGSVQVIQTAIITLVKFWNVCKLYLWITDTKSVNMHSSFTKISVLKPPMMFVMRSAAKRFLQNNFYQG